MLSLALGEGGDVGSGVGNGESSFYSDPASLARSQQPPFAAAAAREPTAGSQSLDALRREISLARRSLPMASTGSTTGQRRGEQQQQRGPRPLLVFREGSAAERELARAAGGATAEFDSVGRQGHALSRGVVDLFFRAWADRCGRLTVPLKQTVDGDSSRGGGGGASGKDDRYSTWSRGLRARRLAFCPYREIPCVPLFSCAGKQTPIPRDVFLLFGSRVFVSSCSVEYRIVTDDISTIQSSRSVRQTDHIFFFIVSSAGRFCGFRVPAVESLLCLVFKTWE